MGKVFDDRSVEPIVAKFALDRQRMDGCRTAGTAKAVIEADVALADRLGVRGTPAFFFGLVERDGRIRVSKAMAGLRQLSEFKDAVERLLAAQQ